MAGDLLTLRGMSKYLGLHTREIHELIRRGTLGEPTLGARGAMLWTRDQARAACISFDYHTHRGEVRRVWVTARTATPHTNPTEHYPDYSVKLTGWDVDRAAWRTYKLNHVMRWHDGTL